MWRLSALCRGMGVVTLPTTLPLAEAPRVRTHAISAMFLCRGPLKVNRTKRSRRIRGWPSGAPKAVPATACSASVSLRKCTVSCLATLARRRRRLTVKTALSLACEGRPRTLRIMIAQARSTVSSARPCFSGNLRPHLLSQAVGLADSSATTSPQYFYLTPSFTCAKQGTY